MVIQILAAIAAVFAVLGIVTLIDHILISLVKPDRNERYFAVRVFDKYDENPSLTVSFILSKLMRSGEYKRCYVIAVDNGMDHNRRMWLEETFAEERHVIICNVNELERIIFEMTG